MTATGCILVTALATACIGGAGTASPPSFLPLAPDHSHWVVSTQGPYDVFLDMRGLWQTNAHWEISTEGNRGEIVRTVTIPENWARPIKLRLFLADDYVGWGIDRSKGPSWFVATTFVGHRFKQVLLDGRLLWEQDVADTGFGQYVDIDLGTSVWPGQTIELTLRLYDKVASDVELPSDYHHIGDPAGVTPDWEKPSTYLRFETRSLWGDMTLYDTTVSEAQLAAALRRDWLKDAEPQGLSQRGAFGVPADGPIGLTLECDSTGPLPEGGFPVRSGVPFARGMLQAAGLIELRDPDGTRIPAQTTVLSRWKDGSVKWLLVDFIACPQFAERRYEVIWQEPEQVDRPSRLRVQETTAGIQVSAGALSFAVPAVAGAILLADVARADGTPVSPALTGSLDCHNQDAEEAEPPGPTVRYTAVRERATVESAGPVRATVRIDGRLLDEAGIELGPFVMRVTAWEGLPYLHVTFRVSNASSEHRRLDDLRLTLAAPDGAAPWAGLEPVVCEQASYEAPGPDGVLAADGFGVGARYFWQRFPQAIGPSPEALTLQFYRATPTDTAQNWLACGESRRDEMMITLAGSAQENEKALQTFLTPPRLFDAQWHCQSGGWGMAAPHIGGRFPELDAAMRAYFDSWRGVDTFGKLYGARDFGDMRYGEGWYNNYYDMAHALFGEYLMGGDRWHFQRAESMTRHLMNVDQVHFSLHDAPTRGEASSTLWDAYPGLRRETRVGANTGTLRGEGTSRYHNLANANDYKTLGTRPYLDLYHMTGDPEALEAALLIGDYIRREGIGVGGRSAREQAFPLTALMVVYQETYDPQLLAAAQRLVDDIIANSQPRRGAYVETFLSFEYMANGGGMVTQITEGLMLHWVETQDPKTAEAIVAMTSAVYDENMGGPNAMPCYRSRKPGAPFPLPPGEGERGTIGVTHYSGNPFQKNWAPEYVYQVCQAFAYAYDLTGRAEFLEALRGGYKAAADAGQLTAMYCYWPASILLYYLDATSGADDCVSGG